MIHDIRKDRHGKRTHVLKIAMGLSVILSCGAVNAAISDVCQDGIYTNVVDGIAWHFSICDGNSMITYIDRSTSGVISIPSELGGCPVTRIGWFAFEYCGEITDLTIPSSITNIGYRAFCDCTNLTSLTLSPSAIDPYLNPYYFDTSRITNVVVSAGETEIPCGAFELFYELQSITIPEGVTNIGEGAFHDLCSLEYVSIPKSVMSIGEDAFSGCSQLGDGIVIVDGCLLTVNGEVRITKSFLKRFLTDVRLIAGGAFKFGGGSWSVGDLTIPSSVISIGARAFYGCSKLYTVTIPSTLISIGDDAFGYCDNLYEFFVDDDNPQYKSIDGLLMSKDGGKLIRGISELVEIPSCVTSIGNFAFSGCSGLTSVTIPSSVTSIGDSAFSGCSGLTSVTIPSSVTSIGDSAFLRCSGLTSVSIPSSVTNIANYVFYSCRGLESVTMPSNVTSIGDHAFNYCYGLTNIVFEGDAPSCVSLDEWSSRCFSGVSSECTATVYSGTKGWDDDGDGVWQGLRIVYRPREGEPIPDIGESPSEEQIAAALDGSADNRLKECIKDGSNYAAYRKWAENVKTSDGSGSAGAQAVKESAHAWLSYALGVDKLLDDVPKTGDITVDDFKPTSTTGSFDFTVSVDKISVGDGASPDNLAKVFGIEGGTTPNALSSGNVNISFGTPVDGKVKFTAGPKDTTQSAFFMKVKMTP